VDIKAFEDFQDSAENAGLVYYYSGHFDEEVRRSLSGSLKERLAQESAAGAIKRKLFSTFMEMAQNVLHYGGCVEVAGNAKSKPGAIALGRDDNSYWIVCANLVLTDHVSRITEKLSALQQMSIAEIKAAYREQLANDAHDALDTLSKGAGLGFLTIARDSAHPIEYKFLSDQASEGRLAYFYIKAFV
jgi:hypothetical protein